MPPFPTSPPVIPKRYNVLGVGISALTLARATDLVIAAQGSSPAKYICFATAHGLAETRADPALRKIYNRSWLTTPDGIPLVWLGPKGVERVYGPDLMLAVCEAGLAHGLRHFLYGGKVGVAEELRGKLTQRFPGIKIVGTATPPFRALSPAESTSLHDSFERLRPDVTWVGLGTPKQERFMAEFAPTLRTSVLLGVGAAFDFHSGRVPQAPRWMQRSGLEWAFRLGAEPRRLGPRYLKTNPAFAFRALAQRLGLKNYPLE